MENKSDPLYTPTRHYDRVTSSIRNPLRASISARILMPLLPRACLEGGKKSARRREKATEIAARLRGCFIRGHVITPCTCACMYLSHEHEYARGGGGQVCAVCGVQFECKGREAGREEERKAYIDRVIAGPHV